MKFGSKSVIFGNLLKSSPHVAFAFLISLVKSLPVLFNVAPASAVMATASLSFSLNHLFLSLNLLSLASLTAFHLVAAAANLALISLKPSSAQQTDLLYKALQNGNSAAPVAASFK